MWQGYTVISLFFATYRKVESDIDAQHRPEHVMVAWGGVASREGTSKLLPWGLTRWMKVLKHDQTLHAT